MAIELAIGVMFLLMAFTIILLTTAGLQNSSLIKDRDSFYEKVELDQIGEEACLKVLADDDVRLDEKITIRDDYYMIVESSENFIYRLNILRDDETVRVIEIEISNNGDSYKIISWN